MEILLFLFIIGVILIVALCFGGIIMTPIVVACGFIYMVFSMIFKALLGLLRLFLAGLRTISDIENSNSENKSPKQDSEREKQYK